MSTKPSVTTNNYGLTTMNLDKYTLINVEEQPASLDYTQYLRSNIKSKQSEYIKDTLEGKTEEQLNYYYNKLVTKVVLHLASSVLDIYTKGNTLLYSMKITKTDHYNSYIAYIRTVLSNMFSGIQYNCLEQSLTYLPNKADEITFSSIYFRLMNGRTDVYKSGLAYKSKNIAYPIAIPIKLKANRVYEVNLNIRQYDIFDQTVLNELVMDIPSKRRILLSPINAHTKEVQMDCIIDLAQYISESVDDAIMYSYIVEITVRDCSMKQLPVVHHSANNYYMYLKSIPSITTKELVSNFTSNVKADIKWSFKFKKCSSIFKTLLFGITGYVKFGVGFTALLIYFIYKYHKTIRADFRYMRRLRKSLNQSYAIVSESSTEVHSFTENIGDNVTSSIDDTATTEAINANIETAINISTLTNFILNTSTNRCQYLVRLVEKCHTLYQESLQYKDAGLVNFNRILKAYTKNMTYLNEVYINQYKLLNIELESKIIESIESLRDFMKDEIAKMKELNAQFDNISRSYLYDKLTKLSNEVNAYKEI